MITKKYYKLIRVSHADSEYFRITNISNEVGEFSIDRYTSGTLEYSTDGVTWESYNLSTKPGVSVNPNANIYLRGTDFKNSSTGSTVINFTKDYTVGGNFMSLNNYGTMSTVNTIDINNYIKAAFKNQTHLIGVENLNFGNVSSIGQEGLADCFFGCSNLTTGPDLSNISSIGNYGLSNCFYQCTKLTTGPDLSNITSVSQNGLDSCFRYCSKISTVTAPNISDLTANSVLNNWLGAAGSSATGTKTVLVPTGATIATNSNSGIPSGWTRVDY